MDPLVNPTSMRLCQPTSVWRGFASGTSPCAADTASATWDSRLRYLAVRRVPYRAALAGAPSGKPSTMVQLGSAAAQAGGCQRNGLYASHLMRQGSEAVDRPNHSMANRPRAAGSMSALTFCVPLHVPWLSGDHILFCFATRQMQQTINRAAG